MLCETVKVIPVVLTLLLHSRPILLAQGPDTDARAVEVLEQARAALGGDAALNAIESLSASGDFRVGSGESQVPGELKLEVLLPDKLVRRMKWSPQQSMHVTAIEAINGDHVWTDSEMDHPNQTMGMGSPGGGGMGRRGGRRSGRSTSGGTDGGGSEGEAPVLEDGMADQQIRAYFSCLILSMLLRSPDSLKSKLDYQGDVDVNGVKGESLRITTKDGLIVNLAIDRLTHRPIMASYSVPIPNTGGQRPKRAHRVNGQTVVEDHQTEAVEIYFSEYRAVAEKKLGEIWLPYQITRTSGGLTVEDMHIKTFQLNPHLSDKQFEPKR